MHRSSWTILVLLVLIPTCNLRAEWTSPLAYDPAYHFLAVPLDPWTYSTAAGPAGGWGITATSSNPASLAFGPAFSAGLSWLDGYDDIKSLAVGTPLPLALRFGLAATWQPGRKVYSWDNYWFPYPFINGVYRSQSSWQATLACRVSPALGVGTTVRYTQTTNIEQWALAEDVHRHLYSKSTDWTLDLGIRLAGMFSNLTIGTPGSSSAPADQQLWTSGMTIGLSLQNVRIASERCGPDAASTDSMPTRIEAGISWLVAGKDRSAFTLNSTCLSWINDQRSGRVFTRDVLLDFGRWGFGAAVDLGGIVGGGASYWFGYKNGVEEFSWFLSVGVRGLQLMFSKGYEMRSRDAYHDFWGPVWEQDYANRLYLRALIPLGYTPAPKPSKSIREDPNSWRTVP